MILHAFSQHFYERLDRLIEELKRSNDLKERELDKPKSMGLKPHEYTGDKK